jgi:type 1 glutamine amidotransferase
MLRPTLLLLVVSLSLGGVACGKAEDSPSGSAATSGSGGVEMTGGSGHPSGGVAEGGGSAGTLSSQGGAASGRAGTSGAGSLGGGGENTSGGPGGSGGGAGNQEVSLLIFSRTAQYRHDSIPAGVQALSQLASERGWQVTATEDASQFSDSGLGSFSAVIFLSTTGDVLNAEQQAAFERFIRADHGFVGIHSATDTEYDWPWYGALVGAYFREHPTPQAADVVIEDDASPATAGLPSPWHRSDEWYAFQANPRQDVHVLLSLDETSYAPGAANMNGDHPIAWQHEYDGGRAFYTALGHTSESYSDPLFLNHVAGGIVWVLERH